jgi:hypothetical protein
MTCEDGLGALNKGIMLFVRDVRIQIDVDIKGQAYLISHH